MEVNNRELQTQFSGSDQFSEGIKVNLHQSYESPSYHTGESEMIEEALAHSGPLLFKRCTFEGHACPVTTEEDVERVLASLKQDSIWSKASTFPYAFRLQQDDEYGAEENMKQDALEKGSDEGDTGSGEKLLYLLQRWDILNVMVVVTRIDSGYIASLLLGVKRYKVVLDRAKLVLEKCYLSMNEGSPRESDIDQERITSISSPIAQGPQVPPMARFSKEEISYIRPASRSNDVTNIKLQKNEPQAATVKSPRAFIPGKVLQTRTPRSGRGQSFQGKVSKKDDALMKTVEIGIGILPLGYIPNSCGAKKGKKRGQINNFEFDRTLQKSQEKEHSLQKTAEDYIDKYRQEAAAARSLQGNRATWLRAEVVNTRELSGGGSSRKQSQNGDTLLKISATGIQKPIDESRQSSRLNSPGHFRPWNEDQGYAIDINFQANSTLPSAFLEAPKLSRQDCNEIKSLLIPVDCLHTVLKGIRCLTHGANGAKSGWNDCKRVASSKKTVDKLGVLDLSQLTEDQVMAAKKQLNLLPMPLPSATEEQAKMVPIIAVFQDWLERAITLFEDLQLQLKAESALHNEEAAMKAAS